MPSKRKRERRVKLDSKRFWGQFVSTPLCRPDEVVGHGDSAKEAIEMAANLGHTEVRTVYVFEGALIPSCWKEGTMPQNYCGEKV